MTKPVNAVDLDQAVFFVYPDSEASRQEFEQQNLHSEKEFMKNKLMKIWTEIKETISSLTSEYFWHDEGIHWEIIDRTCNPFNAFLSGKIRFGDGMEDEWFVIRLLKYLTSKNSSLVCSIFDTDGDFILIEAAEVLPEWLEPENSKNRVFIHEGNVKIVPIEKFKNEPSLQEALKFIKSGSGGCPAFNEEINRVIERKVFEKQKLHKTRVRIPMRIAKILSVKRQLVGPAVSAFYNREPESMRFCTLMKNFNPWKSGSPMVLTTVSMTRIQFAQLACQEFVAPSNENVNFDVQNCENSIAAELGMKLACGFEILLSSEESKFISKNLFEAEQKSVQNEIEEILKSEIEGNFICDESEDDLSWMEISEDVLESELKSKLSLNEQEKTDLINTWTREYENGNEKLSEIKEEISEIDKIVENMKKMIESTSNFEGIEADNRDDNSEDEDDGFDSDNSDDYAESYDSEDDEMLLEREIFETINFDPDLLMKILEANAHMEVSSEEFLKRFRKYQEENPVTERKQRKQKGLADIDEDKLNEARKSSRKVYEDVKETEETESDEAVDSDVDADEIDDDDEDVGDEFIYGQTLDQLKQSSQVETEISDDNDSDDHIDEKSPLANPTDPTTLSDYYDAMDRELQSELKQYNPDLDETSNLGKSVIETMMAARGGSGVNPMETVISGLGKQMPRG